MLGLSKELIKTLGLFRCNCAIISPLVNSSAVAVRAIIGMLGKVSLIIDNLEYSGLKSCPHCETQ